MQVQSAVIRSHRRRRRAIANFGRVAPGRDFTVLGCGGVFMGSREILRRGRGRCVAVPPSASPAPSRRTEVVSWAAAQREGALCGVQAGFMQLKRE